MKHVLCLTLLALLSVSIATASESDDAKKGAITGDSEAQIKLGRMYAVGSGVPKNDAQAVIWYRKAADQGRAEAQWLLGRMYADGQGIPQDDVQAVNWYRKAADQGYAQGQYWLGTTYINGIGVPQDIDEAVVWFRKAADQGYADAQCFLGVIYISGLGGGRPDIDKAVIWFRKAADQGHAEAQNNLGKMYEAGRGVPQDDLLAYMWLCLAAAQDSKSYTKARDLVSARLTPEQRAEGQKMAREWKPTPFTPTGEGDPTGEAPSNQSRIHDHP
jgi:TPR repeat protein